MRTVVFFSIIALSACSVGDASGSNNVAKDNSSCGIAVDALGLEIKSSSQAAAKKALDRAFMLCKTPSGEKIAVVSEPQRKAIVKEAVVKTDWRKRVDKSEMTDDKSVYLSVQGTSIPDSIGRDYKPSLYIRCHENTTSFFINWDNYLGDDDDSVYTTKKYMRIRLDDAKPFRKLFDVSTDNESAGLWSGGSSIPFIKGMIGKNTMVVEVTPYNESTKQTKFNVSGLSKEIAELRETCKW